MFVEIYVPNIKSRHFRNYFRMQLVRQHVVVGETFYFNSRFVAQLTKQLCHINSSTSGGCQVHYLAYPKRGNAKEASLFWVSGPMWDPKLSLVPHFVQVVSDRIKGLHGNLWRRTGIFELTDLIPCLFGTTRLSWLFNHSDSTHQPFFMSAVLGNLGNLK